MNTSLSRLFINTALMICTLCSISKAATEEDVQDFTDILSQQTHFLSRQEPKSCSARYQKLFSHASVNIGIFYGYTDADDVTVDASMAQALIQTLKKPCVGELGACGFQSLAHSSSKSTLHKVILFQNQRKDIYLTVAWSSFSDDEKKNKDKNSLMWDQIAQSKETRSDFLNALTTMDMVVYDGHSRLGGGPGFVPDYGLQILFNKIVKIPVYKFQKALAQAPSRLQMLGMLSCQSQRYYRQAIEKARPDLALFDTSDDIEIGEGEQYLISTLHSVLVQECPSEFKRSWVSQDQPQHAVLEMVNF